MNRRTFLSLLGRGMALTAGGLLVPEAPKRVYSFLTNNPLAAKPILQDIWNTEPLTVTRVTANVDQWGSYLYWNESGVWVVGQDRSPKLISEALPDRSPSRHTHTVDSSPID